jgi:signal transduction histidine kinase
MRVLRSILARAGRQVLPDPRTRVHREELVVVAAFAAVVACFAATTTYSEATAAAVTQQSCTLPDRTLPCVVELDRMRTELRDVARLVERAEHGRESDLVRRLVVEFDRMEKSTASYEALTGGNVDGTTWTTVRDAIRSVQSTVRSISSKIMQSEPLDLAGADLDERIRQADGALEDAVAMYRARLELASDGFGAAEVKAARTALALQSASVLVATAVVASTIGMLRKRRRQTESRLDELGQFAARVAHDLRSPLMPPMLALDRVRARLPPGDPLAGNVERGARSLKTIERLVEGLLAFASSGTSPSDASATSICETLEAILAEYTDAAATAGIALSVDCPCEARVRCSPGTFVSIVSNLVGNAIKYMGSAVDRRVTVHVTVGTQARIEVVDTGPGIPAGAEERIFEPYVRGHTGGFGIGLGLATVQRLVLAHGGRLGVFRNQGPGSTFWVELPIAAVDGAPARRNYVIASGEPVRRTP